MPITSAKINTPASLRSELIAIRSESLIDIAGIANQEFYRRVVEAMQKQDSQTEAVASRTSKVFHDSKDCPVAQRINEKNRVTGSAARENRRPHKGCPSLAGAG